MQFLVTLKHETGTGARGVGAAGGARRGVTRPDILKRRKRGYLLRRLWKKPRVVTNFVFFGSFFSSKGRKTPLHGDSKKMFCQK